MFHFYQNIPSYLDPIAFAVGSFSVGWYALMYLVALVIIFLLAIYRIKKREGGYKKEMILDLLLFSMLGALIGGRLGYVLFYNPSYYAQNLLEIFSPYNFSTGYWIGIYGMSYHGGLIGVIGAFYIFAKRKKQNFWQLADFIVPAVPAGYFFGRIGNFFNGELYGRMTESSFGMYFSPAENFLRYPSQLIEASLEGIAIFVLLWPIRNKPKFSGYFVVLYLVGYGTVRIIGEFFREPDEHIGFIFGYFTLGQILSCIMIFAGVMIYFQRKKKML